MRLFCLLLAFQVISQYLPLKNKMNMAYYVAFGFLFFFSIFNQLSYVPALGSHGCSNDREFNYNNSKSFEELKENYYQNVTKTQYLIGNATGILGEDNLQSTGNNFYYLITSQPILVGKSSYLLETGRCGLFSLGLDSHQTNYSVVYNLFAQHRIADLSFSLFLNNIGFNGKDKYETSSCVIFGGYNMEKYAKDPKSTFRYHNISVGTPLWEVQASSFSLGSYLVSNTSELMILEVSFSFIAIPEKIFQTFIEKIGKKIICNNNGSFLICPCKESFKLPSLYFVIDGYEYSLPATFYIKQEDDEKCILCVVASSASTWVLGQVFLRRYYSYYNMKTRQIGLVESIYYKASGHKHSKALSDEWLLTIIGITTFVVVGFVTTLCWVYMKHKRPLRYSVLSSDSDFVLTGK